MQEGLVWLQDLLNYPHPEVEATTASGRVGGTHGRSNYQPRTQTMGETSNLILIPLLANVCL